MGEPVRLNGSACLQFKDGTHQPLLKMKEFTKLTYPVEGELPDGTKEIHQNFANIAINGVSNHDYQLQISQDLHAWQDYGQLLTVDDVDGQITNIAGIDVEEIVISKPINNDKEFYRVISISKNKYQEMLEQYGLTGHFTSYELAKMGLTSNLYALKSMFASKYLGLKGIPVTERVVVSYDKSPENMSWEELQSWLTYVGIDASCISSGSFRTTSYINLSIALLKLFEGRMKPIGNTGVPLEWINSYDRWSLDNLIYLYIQKGIDRGCITPWRNVSSAYALSLFENSIAPTPDKYNGSADLSSYFSIMDVLASTSSLASKLNSMGITGYEEYATQYPEQATMEYAQCLVANQGMILDIDMTFADLVARFPVQEDLLTEISWFKGVIKRLSSYGLHLDKSILVYSNDNKLVMLEILKYLDGARNSTFLEIFNVNSLDSVLNNYDMESIGLHLKNFDFEKRLTLLKVKLDKSRSDYSDVEQDTLFNLLNLLEGLTYSAEISFDKILAFMDQGKSLEIAASIFTENQNIIKVNQSSPGFVPEKKTYSNAEDVVINSVVKMIDEGIDFSTFDYQQLLSLVNENLLQSPEQLIEYLEFISTVQANIAISKENNSEKLKIDLSLVDGSEQIDYVTANILDASGKLITKIYSGEPTQNLSVLWDRRDNLGKVVNGKITVELVCEKYVSGLTDLKKEIMTSANYNLSQLDFIYDSQVVAVGVEEETTAITYVTGYADNGLSDKSYGADTTKYFELKCPQRIFVHYADSAGDSAYYANLTRLNSNNQWEGVQTFRSSGDYYLNLMPGTYSVHINNPCWFGDKYVLYNINYKTPQFKQAVFDKYGEKISENVIASSFNGSWQTSVIIDNEEFSPLYIGAGYVEILRKNLHTAELYKLKVEFQVNADKVFVIKQQDGNLLLTWYDKSTNKILSEVIDLSQTEHDWKQLDWQDRAFAKTEIFEHGLVSENIQPNDKATEVLQVYVEQISKVINAITPTVTHDITLEELIALCRYRKVVEQNYPNADEADQHLRNIASADIIPNLEAELANQAELAVNWLQNSGYEVADREAWLLNSYASIAIYNAVKNISFLANDMRIDINALFASYDEGVSNNGYNVSVLTDFLRLNNLYKGNNLFRDTFSGDVDEQEKYVAPRYEDILKSLELRKSLENIFIPIQNIAETEAEVNVLLNNLYYQKMVAFHRFVMDLNTYSSSLRLTEYVTANGKLSYADYYSKLISGQNPGLVSYLATKHYFDTQVIPGQPNIFIDTVGSYKLLYSGQAIFVQEPGEIYYRMSKIVMPSHFSVIQKVSSNEGGFFIKASGLFDSSPQLPAELQRELWFYLIREGYLTSEGVITQRFIDMQALANASADKDAYIGEHFVLPVNLAGYEVSSFNKIAEMGLGEWIPVKDKMILVGGDNWVNTAEHTINIARKVGNNYENLKTITQTYFDATSFVGLFKDISTLAVIDALPYSNDSIADWCFELDELMADNDLFNKEIPDLKRYLSYRNAGNSVVYAY
ncbi:MAG: hypothetical protein PHF25_06510, partial [Candidatus Margulisbacteria bacterium]|nr:hypothetical protein [Candidatus Margulisiibacteriota bacterium]